MVNGLWNHNIVVPEASVPTEQPEGNTTFSLRSVRTRFIDDREISTFKIARLLE